MELRTCKNTGLKLSVLGYGCWELGGGAYWGDSDQENITNIVHAAVDGGINYFDSAEMYNEGRSEEYLGKAVKGIPRDKVVLGTKAWVTNLAPEDLRKHCEDSLKRLDSEYIDLYMIHWPLNERTYPLFTDTSKMGGKGVLETSVDMPRLEDTVATLLKLKEEGKILYPGVSNHGVERMKEIQDIGGVYAVNQIGYNLITRAAEMEVLPYCAGEGIGIIAYMVLMQGLLTDRYDSLDDIPDWYTRTRHFSKDRTPKSRHGEPGAEKELIAALADIKALAKETGYSTADLALKWTVSNPDVTCTLVGTQNMDRLKSNIAAVEKPLEQDIVERLNTITAPLKEKMGPCMDVFESAANDRTR